MTKDQIEHFRSHIGTQTFNALQRDGWFDRPLVDLAHYGEAAIGRIPLIGKKGVLAILEALRNTGINMEAPPETAKRLIAEKQEQLAFKATNVATLVLEVDEYRAMVREGFLREDEAGVARPTRFAFDVSLAILSFKKDSLFPYSWS